MIARRSVAMVKVSLAGDRVRFDVEGAHWLLAVKRRIEVRARKIARVTREPDLPFAAGIRVGTGLPGLLRAGSYWWNGRWTFWDVRFAHRDHMIRVDLEGASYTTLFIEVADPDEAIGVIEEAHAIAG
jgi:hypothetical protein